MMTVMMTVMTDNGDNGDDNDGEFPRRPDDSLTEKTNDGKRPLWVYHKLLINQIFSVTWLEFIIEITMWCSENSFFLCRFL